jgi:glycosyltransferase involved in cell wall biosynthesis
MSSRPLVSIVTPVHNGAQFIAQCITSVLAQTYDNWEYLIVENKSEDETLNIIRQYAIKEPRIKVIETNELLPVMKNWNYALSKISDQSKYCKIIHADDLLYPNCVEEMVGVAEEYPSVGLVGSYSLWGNQVRGDRLEAGKSFFSGREIAKLTLQRLIYPFLSPSVLLIRSSILRENESFYNESILYADVDSCYKVLEKYDFGFVNQVLTNIGRHESSLTSKECKPLNTLIWQNFDLFLRHGKTFLSEEEYSIALLKRKIDYYQFLGASLFARKGSDFWDYHRKGLKKIGVTFSYTHVLCYWIALKMRVTSFKFERLIERFYKSCNI